LFCLCEEGIDFFFCLMSISSTPELELTEIAIIYLSQSDFITQFTILFFEKLELHLDRHSIICTLHLIIELGKYKLENFFEYINSGI